MTQNREAGKKQRKWPQVKRKSETKQRKLDTKWAKDRQTGEKRLQIEKQGKQRQNTENYQAIPKSIKNGGGVGIWRKWTNADKIDKKDEQRKLQKIRENFKHRNRLGKIASKKELVQNRRNCYKLRQN